MVFYERHAFSLAKRALDQLDFKDRKKRHNASYFNDMHGVLRAGHRFAGDRPLSARSFDRTHGYRLYGLLCRTQCLKACAPYRSCPNRQPPSPSLIWSSAQSICRKPIILNKCSLFLIFADGCARQPRIGKTGRYRDAKFYLEPFYLKARIRLPWHIGGFGFDMVLLGKVPVTVAKNLPIHINSILGGTPTKGIAHLGRASRRPYDFGRGTTRHRPASAHAKPFARYPSPLWQYVVAATVMFVLKEMLQPGTQAGRGCAMAFGPGLTVESMLFQTAGG